MNGSRSRPGEWQKSELRSVARALVVHAAALLLVACTMLLIILDLLPPLTIFLVGVLGLIGMMGATIVLVAPRFETHGSEKSSTIRRGFRQLIVVPTQLVLGKRGRRVFERLGWRRAYIFQRTAVALSLLLPAAFVIMILLLA